MFRFQIIFLTWSHMWRTWRHDTSTLSSPIQWHYMAPSASLKTPRASNYIQRPYNYISAANDNSSEHKKGAECTLDEKFPPDLKVVLRDPWETSAICLQSARVPRSLKYWTKGQNNSDFDPNTWSQIKWSQAQPFSAIRVKLIFLIFSDIIIQVRGITRGSDSDRGNKNCISTRRYH